MKRWKILAGCFLAGAVLLIFVAVVRIARGGDDSAVFLALGGTFCALAATFIALKGGRAKNPASSDSSPPAA